MNKTKAIVDFSHYRADDLGPIARTILNKMTLNAATFPSPAIPVMTLLAQLATYDARLVDRASNASSDVLAFNVSRDALEKTLGVMGQYVNSIAMGDPTVVDMSGFPSYETSHTPDLSPPLAPADLRLRHGILSGSIVARYKPARPKSINEVQTNAGDPNNAADWHFKGIFNGGKAAMDGFTPGAVIWVRVRTVGLKGVMGAWSDPAQIRVL